MIAQKYRLVGMLLPLVLCSVMSCGVANETAPHQPQSAPKGAERLLVWGDGWCNMNDGGFTDDQCDFLQDAINALFSSSDPACQDLASDAQGFLNGKDFTPGYLGADGDMGVPMVQSSTSYSGFAYTPTGGGIIVDANVFSHSTKEIGALLAHEMEHAAGMDGPTHNTGIANFMQTQCLNSIP